MEWNHRNDLENWVMTCMIVAVAVSSAIRPSEQLKISSKYTTNVKYHKKMSNFKLIAIKCMYLCALEIYALDETASSVSKHFTCILLVDLFKDLL